MYLLNSDFIITLLKQSSKSQKILSTLIKKTDVPFAISVISLAEIQEGLLATSSENRLSHFRKLLQTMYILPITTQTSLTFAKTRLHLRKKGLLIDNMDLLIAATCLEHHLTLVTFNTKHFNRVPKLKIYDQSA
jgi:predicted nucleic acid-binding protein